MQKLNIINCINFPISTHKKYENHKTAIIIHTFSRLGRRSSLSTLRIEATFAPSWGVSWHTLAFGGHYSPSNRRRRRNTCWVTVHPINKKTEFLHTKIKSARSKQQWPHKTNVQSLNHLFSNFIKKASKNFHSLKFLSLPLFFKKILHIHKHIQR